MFYESKNFEGENKDIIEIVPSKSAFGLLRECGNKNIKVCLPLSLCIGKFDSLTPFNRESLKEYFDDEDQIDFTNEFNELKEYVKNCKKIRVWSSHLNCDDYCLLLLICYLFQDKEISVLFSEEIDWEANSFGFVSAKEIKNIEYKEHVLNDCKKKKYSDKWEKVVSENKELRYMLNGEVVSCDIDNFDNDIMDRIKKMGNTYISYAVANLLVYPLIPCVMYSDSVYFYLINRLEKKGLIKSSIVDNKKYIEVK